MYNMLLTRKTKYQSINQPLSQSVNPPIKPQILQSSNHSISQPITQSSLTTGFHGERGPVYRPTGGVEPD